jgi:outer membrane protein assembly factor BamB
VFLDRYSPTNGGNVGQLLPGFLLNITQPDGTTQIIGPWTCSSAVASDFKVFTPSQVGTYKIVFSWPGTTIVSTIAVASSDSIGDYLAGSTSAPFYLTVTQEPIQNWPEPPLPTDYWTSPINAQNRGWSTLASNWLKGTWLSNNYQNEGTGPKTAHVLWTEPICASSPSSEGYPGGIADEAWPSKSTNLNDYASPWSAPIIMNGRIYYNAPGTAQSDKYGYYCVDLYSGQQIWYKNGTDNGLNNPVTLSAYTGAGGITAPNSQTYPLLSLGQMKYYFSVNGEGVASYLWMQVGTTWYMLDATTGNWILTLTNVPSGTGSTDQDGDLLIYSYSRTTGQFLCWNSSKAIYPGGPTGTGEQCWRPPMGLVINAVNDTAWVNAGITWGTSLDPALKAALTVPHSGYTMNYTSASLIGLPGSMAILRDDNRVPKQIFGNSITATYGSIGGSITSDNIAIWLATINEHATDYSPYPGLTTPVQTNLGFTVTLNYNKTITVPLPGNNYTWTISPVDYNSQVFFVDCQQTSQRWCYSLTTGEKLWGPTVSTLPWGYYDQGGGGVYKGIFIAIASSFDFEGEILAYKVTTGDLLWTYNSTAAPYGYESAYGDNMPLTLGAVCDGMIYTYSTEHSPTNPLWRQSYVRCMNLTTGQEIWKLEDFNMGLGISNGYIVSANQYDNKIYCIGNGPSGTTVAAPQTVPTLGSSLMITGAVTDQSPGAKAYATKYGLTNGVAAVSDSSQEAWMEYIYEQQAKPTNATGVPVTLAAIDPNGNFIPIGTTTTDLTGTYGYMFTPQIPGTYRILVTFAGTNSYGSSSTQTYLGVGESAPTALPVPVTVQPPTEMFVLGIGVAIIVAIAVVGVVLVLMIRKRP